MNPYKIIDIKKSELEGSMEPVTLDEVKQWLKITFSDDDDVINNLIPSSRECLEEYCISSVHLCQYEVIVDLDFSNNRECYIEFELPYGPISLDNGTSDIIVERSEGQFSELFTVLVQGDDYSIVGNNFYKLRVNVPGRYKITYNATYSQVPKALKTAIMIDVAEKYENRGDSGGDVEPVLSEKAKQKAKPFKRMTWL